MKFCALIVAGMLLAAPAFAQSPAGSPATKEEIQHYFELMHTRELMHTMMDTMAGQMHQFVHQQFESNAAKLPPDFETRMNRIMDDMLKSMPVDELLDLMVPVYQKHFTKADIDAMIAFYSTPTGEKILRDMPAIMQESMQAYMPLLRKQMAKMQQRVETEVAEMIKEEQEKAKTARP